MGYQCLLKKPVLDIDSMPTLTDMTWPINAILAHANLRSGRLAQGAVVFVPRLIKAPCGIDVYVNVFCLSFIIINDWRVCGMAPSDILYNYLHSYNPLFFLWPHSVHVSYYRVLFSPP